MIFYAQTPNRTVYGSTVADIINIMDFAADDTVPEFNVGPENHFVCVPDIPLGLMQKVSALKNLRETLEKTGDLSVVIDIFDELLTEESARLFRLRVADKTIGVRRISAIIPWILEEYGLGHPSQPSSPSSPGSNDGETGASSQGGAFPSALALGGSPAELPST